MLATLDREFPARLNPNRRRHLFCRLDIRRVEPCVHPNGKGMNQNSMMERISHWGEGLCIGHNSD